MDMPAARAPADRTRPPDRPPRTNPRGGQAVPRSDPVATVWRLVAVLMLCAAPRLGAQTAAESSPDTAGARITAPDAAAVDTAATDTAATDTAAASTLTTDSAAADGTGGPRLTSVAPSFRADTGETRPRAIEYSNAYGTRLAIHRYASYAELPLFAAEYALGQRILNGERNGNTASDGTRSAHRVVAGGLGVLFAVNTVTGVWNLVEARHDPAGRTRRNLHALGMLLADAGFAWTASLAGGAHERDGFEGTTAARVDAGTRHRNVAIASMSVATVSTLMMWLWKD